MKSKVLFCLGGFIFCFVFTGCSHFRRDITNELGNDYAQTNYAIIDSNAETFILDVAGTAGDKETIVGGETTQMFDASQIESLEAMIAEDVPELCIYPEMSKAVSENLNVGDMFSIIVESTETSSCMSNLTDAGSEVLSDVFDKSLLDDQSCLAEGWRFVKVSGEVTFNRSMKYNVFQWNLIATSMDDEQHIVERPELAYTNLTDGDGQYRHYFEFTEDKAYDFIAIYVVSDEVYEQRHLFFNPGNLTFPEIGDGPNSSHVVRIN